MLAATPMKPNILLKGTWSLSSIVPHVIFFWLRTAGFCIILAMSIRVFDVKHANITAHTHNEFLEALDDFVFLTQFNLFELYLAISSLVSSNIYGYYLSIVTMLHNATITMFVSSLSKMFRTRKYFIIYGMISFSFVLEAILTLYLVYLRRFENNLELFKKIGANPRINNAFFIRKILQTLGTINVFLASVSTGKDLLIPVCRFKGGNFLGYGFSFITYLQQVSISVNFNSENLAQRRVAIAISCIKIPLTIGVIVWSSFPLNKSTGLTKEPTIYIFSDILIVTIIMIYYLIKDTQCFGSGIAEYLQCKTRKFDLSDKC